MNTKIMFASLIFILTVGSSCSSSNPVSVVDTDFDAYVISNNTFPGILGIYHIAVDTNELTAELVPARELYVEDFFESVDITNYMTLTPKTDFVVIKGVSLNSSGNLVLEIGVKHPFGKADLGEDPSAANRADLHVFNVEGHVIMSGDVSDILACWEIGDGVLPNVLLNADGYSNYLDAAIDKFYPTFTTINPYKLHFDDFTQGNFSVSNPLGFADIVNPSGYLVMPQGSEMDYQEYEFKLDHLGTPIEFMLAVNATFGLSSMNLVQRLSPVYRLPQFNKKACSVIYVDSVIENDTSGFLEGVAGSSETIVLKILDINYNTPVGLDKDRMKFASTIEKIEVEIPGITNTKVVFNAPSPVSGDPINPNDPLTFHLSINNEKAALTGNYNGLVKAVDSYPVQSNIYVPHDGIERVPPSKSPLDGLFDLTEYCAYTCFEVDVVAGTPPHALFTVRPSNDFPVGLPARFDGSGSFDTDGEITTYQWDFNYDGTNFTLDDVGAVVNHSYGATGTKTVALRVKDNHDKLNIISHGLNVVPIGPVNLESNVLMLSDIDERGLPVGGHCCDSNGDSVYVSVMSPQSPHHIWCLRSDDGGDSFSRPKAVVSDVSADFIEGISCRMTESGKADILWMNSMGWPAEMFHDRADGEYNFGTDSKPNMGNFVAEYMSHDVYGENYVFIGYFGINPFAETWDIFLRVSSNGGLTWSNPDASNVTQKCNHQGEDPSTATIAVDGTGTVHVVYVDDLDKAIYYTKSADFGNTFSNFEILDNSPDIVYNQNYSLAVTEDGQRVFLAYQYFDDPKLDIYCLYSDDGGDTFNHGTLVDDVDNDCYLPCLVLDPFDWGLYCVFQEDINNGDIRFTRCIDGIGETWEPSSVVHTALASTQINPSITVDDELRVHIFWRDDRQDPGNQFDLYYARGF